MAGAKETENLLGEPWNRVRELELQNEELRQANEKLETSLASYADLYDYAPIGYLTLDWEGTILQVNLTGATLLGVDRARLRGRSLASLVHQESVHAWGDLLRGMHEGTARWTGELAFTQVGGVPKYVQVESIRVETGTDKRVQYRAAMMDSSARRLLEEQLRQNQELEAVRTFAGGLARDFANILTGVLTSSSLAIDEAAPGSSLRVELEAIRAAGERTRSLIQQLLAFSCSEALQPKVIDLNDVVRGLERALGRIFEGELSRSVALAANLGQIAADPGKIEQVLLQLARHAREDMQSETFSVETSNVEVDRERAKILAIPPGAYVLLSVTDTGRGMDERTRERVFASFFFTSGAGPGMGLGLSVVYGVVKQSGGWIRVRSQPGRGSTFEVYWPRVGTGTAAQPPTSVRTGETILVVEDNQPVRRTAVRILESLGYRVLSAGGLEEAISQLERLREPIHLLLTDVVMPGANGPEVSRVVSARMPGLRTLYMSGYAHDTFASPGVLAEGTPLVQKPFTREVLAQKVREALDRAV